MNGKPVGECIFCLRDGVRLSSVQACEHCDALFYKVWDRVGGAKPPTRESFLAWATDQTGPVTEGRHKKRFLNQWRNSSGALVRVPNIGPVVEARERVS